MNDQEKFMGTVADSPAPEEASLMQDFGDLPCLVLF